MPDYIISGDVLTDIAETIRSQTGETELIAPEDMPGKVAECYERGYTEGETVGYEAGYAAGKIPVVEKDVNFYNYDGRLLHSYTLEEVQALTELPPAPQMGRDFLSFEEWNWSLEDIKALNLPLCVTATVCPTDGNTKAVLEILDSRVATVTMFIQQTSGVLSVDWGDGSEPTTFAAATNVNRTLEHTYAEVGEYIVTISTDGGCLLGHGGTETRFLYGNVQFLTELYLGRNANLANYGLLAHKWLRVVTFPLGVLKISVSACWQSDCIKSVSLPSTLKEIEQRAFNANYRLNVLSLPASLEWLGYVPFAGANGLHSITIPSKCSDNGARYTSIPQIYIAEGVKGISGEFAYDGVIRSIVIPSTVETIAAQAFRGCNQLERMVFKPLVPPAVANENALAFAKMCIVEVPAESLELYQNATNYGTIAAQMVGV